MIKKIKRTISRILPQQAKKYLTPNKFADKTGVEFVENEIIVHGYQQYKIIISPLAIYPIGINSLTKFNILHYFLKQNIRDKSFIDIGSNNGLFVYMAALYGSSDTIGYDIDTDYIKTSETINRRLSLPHVHFVEKNIEEINISADFTVFLSMIHWVYNKTSLYGSLDSVIEKLASLTNTCLIIEWVSEKDHKVLRDKHVLYNIDVMKEPYDFEHFDAALRKYFSSYELLGVNTPTRLVYAAWK